MTKKTSFLKELGNTECHRADSTIQKRNDSRYKNESKIYYETFFVRGLVFEKIDFMCMDGVHPHTR